MTRILPLLLVGCQGDPSSTPSLVVEDSCETGDTYVWVVHAMGYTRKSPDGEVWGFDLDGHVTDPGDDEGCGLPDAVDPEGTPGIDNAFSNLIPALEATEASAVEGLIQDSINTGELLLLLEVRNVDDLQDDDCVNVSILRGEGFPLVGTDGLLLDGQSFGRSTLPPNASVEGATIEEGVLSVQDLPEVSLPLNILDVEVQFDVQSVGLRLEIPEDGGDTWGFFSGGVPLENILEIVQEGDLGQIRDLVTTLVGTAADLAPDEQGQCQQLSIAFQVDGRPAFFYGEP